MDDARREDRKASADLGFLSGGGEMGARMRAHDWSASPLGPPAGWPQSMRTAVSLILNSKFPMFMAWGPELGFLYNDPYAEILGVKHPLALGRRFEEVWFEIWDDLKPLVGKALAGEAIFHENLPFTMLRRGYEERTWFTFSYSPVRDETGGIGGMFCACTETTREVQARAELNAEGERLRRLFHDAPGFMAVVRGPTHVFEVTNGAYLQLVGHRDLVGRTVREALPDIEGQGFYELLDQVYRTGETFVGRGTPLKIQSRPGGPLEERFVDFVFQPITDPRGAVTGIFVEGNDVTETKRAEAAIRESEARFRGVFNSRAVGLLIIDLDTAEIIAVNDRVLEMTGYSRESFQRPAWGDDPRLMTPPEYRHLDQAAIVQLRERGWCDPYAKEWVTADGSRLPVQLSVAVIPGEPGKIVVSAQDLTERKRFEEHQGLLINELNHRVKNTLATVQSIVAQTLRNASSPGHAREAVEARLLALSRAHDVLTRQNWEGASLTEVAGEALAAHRAGGRIRIAGPEVRVSPRVALGLSMALQELATNAVKYGALSNEAGAVDLRWTLEPGEPPVLRLAWRERGGPPVLPPSRKGFGSRLIERSLAADLGGEARIRYEPGGVVCEVEARLA